jgi:hypothetical protein
MAPSNLDGFELPMAVCEQLNEELRECYGNDSSNGSCDDDCEVPMPKCPSEIAYFLERAKCLTIDEMNRDGLDYDQQALGCTVDELSSHIRYYRAMRDDGLLPHPIALGGTSGCFGEGSVTINQSSGNIRQDEFDEWAATLNIGLGHPDVLNVTMTVIVSSINAFDEDGFGDRGQFVFSFSRCITDTLSGYFIARNIGPWGWSSEGGMRDHYSAGLAYQFILPPTCWMPCGMPLSISAGAGRGSTFELIGAPPVSGRDKSWHFQTATLIQIAPQLSAYGEWTGDQLNAGVGIRPFCWPISIIGSVYDMTKAAPVNKIEWGVTVAYSFKWADCCCP